MARPRSVQITRCSLVVSPVDVWTRKLPGPSALSVSLEGVHKKPIRKPDGTYVFLDLPEGDYVLLINSPSYIPIRETIETAYLDKLNPVFTAALLPGPGYVYPSASTAVSFLLTNNAGVPRPGEPVEAFVQEDAAARGRIAQDRLVAGDNFVTIGLLQGQTVAGESLLLRGQGKQELVCVAEVLPGGVLRFEQPVIHSYMRGAALLPAVRTRSAHNGTVLLPFRGVLPAAFTVKVQTGSGERAVSAEIPVNAGMVNTSPPISF